jgi:NADPH2:quinone reductase
MVAGAYQVKPDLPFVPGVEVSGEVVNAPAGSGFKPGDRVMTLLDSSGLLRGGFAELAEAAPHAVIPMPEGLSFEDAAAFTLVYPTGWIGLHRRANLQAGDTLLVERAPAASAARPSSWARRRARR